jgi:Ulp1 family protease
MLARYLEDEARDKGLPPLDTSRWERLAPKRIPQQHNCCDCGVFALK